MIRVPPQHGGWLEVVCGPMFSGKSEELIRRLRRAEIAGQRVLVVKAGFDDRYDVAHVVSHAGDRIRAVPAMSRLLCHAELVDKLQAVCHRCGGPATRTQRLSNGQPAPFTGPTIQVGALDSYEARCTGCYEPGTDSARVELGA